jgi:hypothetical protein
VTRHWTGLSIRVGGAECHSAPHLTLRPEGPQALDNAWPVAESQKRRVRLSDQFEAPLCLTPGLALKENDYTVSSRAVRWYLVFPPCHSLPVVFIRVTRDQHCLPLQGFNRTQKVGRESLRRSQAPGSLNHGPEFGFANSNPR